MRLAGRPAAARCWPAPFGLTRRAPRRFPRSDGSLANGPDAGCQCCAAAIACTPLASCAAGRQRGLREAWRGVSLPPGERGQRRAHRLWRPAVQWAQLGLALTVPLLMAVGLLLARRVRRVPSRRLVGASGDLAVPWPRCSCSSTAALALGTARQESVHRPSPAGSRSPPAPTTPPWPVRPGRGRCADASSGLQAKPARLRVSPLTAD